MDFIGYYLGHHKDKNIVYFAGMNSDWSSLVLSLKMSCFDKFYIVLEDTAEKAVLIENLEKNSIDNYQLIDKNEINSKYSDYTFVFDHFHNKGDLLYLAKLVHHKIVGYFDSEYPVIDIWEVARDNCQEIILSRFVNDVRNETLEWKKEPGNDIELSVIFPTYNVEKYLDKCLATITEWDAPYVEYIFVDDGSKDGSANVIKEWIKKDSRIKLLQKENGGCASARQYGIDNSHGRYIGLIDPDDFIDPSMFKKLLFRALTGTYDISYSGYNEFYEESQTSQKIDDYIGFPLTIGTSDKELIDSLIAYRRIAIWRGIYRRQFLLDNNIRFHTEFRRFDDLPFKVETFARAKSVVSVEEYLYYYRMGRPGQDVSANDERLYVHFDIFKALDEFFAKGHNSSQMHYYRIVKIQTHFWALTLLDQKFVPEYLRRAAEDLEIKNNPSVWKKVFSECYKKKDVSKIMKIIGK